MDEIGWLPSLDTAERIGQIVLFILCVYAAAIWVTLVYWTFRDIRQRTRDSVLQLFAVLLVACLFLPGHWIYLILRPRYTLSELYERSLEEEALLQELEDQKGCPNCKRRVKDDYLICPFCRVQLKELCRSCSKPMNYAWVACPFCGYEKPRVESQQPRRVAGQQQRQAQSGTRPRPVASPPTRVPTADVTVPAGTAAAAVWPAEQPAPAPQGTPPPSRSGALFGSNGDRGRPAPGEEGVVIDATADPA